MWWKYPKICRCSPSYTSPRVGSILVVQNSPMASNMTLDTTKEYPEAEETVLHIGLKFKLLLGPKCAESIKKLADTPSFRHTASPQVGSSSGSKLSKHYYGCKYDLRYITQSSTGNENGLKCKLGPKCGENIQNLADAPSFCHTASPQVGSSSGSKLSKHYYGCKYDLRYITQSSIGHENGL